MSEWRIQRRQARCRACERDFAEGERHASGLAVRGEELEREDLCEPCWARREHETLLHWFTRHHQDKRKLQLDLGTLEAIFLRLEGHGAALDALEPDAALAQQEQREHVAQLADPRGADGEALIVRRPRRDERLRVFVFDFAADRMAELRGELLALFEGAEIPADPTPAEAAADLAAAREG